MTTSSRTITPPDQADVDAVRDMLDLVADFTDNDQRARYLLSSDWLRDRGSFAAERLLTREQVAGVAETLFKASGMATTPSGNPFLVKVVVEHIERQGITRARIARETGIAMRRLRKVLRNEALMTQLEHKAICAVGSEVRA